MLAQFALLIFGLFAIMSLVIDFGYVTLTRVQMQNAADTAALEGLRRRNVHGNGFEADCERRIAARNLVAWTFDDDFNVGDGAPPDPFQFGAGPLIALDGGETTSGLNGYQRIEPPGAVRVYKPDLRLNQASNAEYGDMVSGLFAYTADPRPSEDPSYPGGGPYSRNDFTPNPSTPNPDPDFAATGCPEEVPETWPTWMPPPEPAGPLGDTDDAAFLVRLRRTSDRDDLANVADVSSGGPALPLLFGRGTTIQGADAGGAYSVRRDGLTVRATAIADARPALRVGWPGSSGNLGVTPFALLDQFIPSAVYVSPSGGTVLAPNATVDATGLIRGLGGDFDGTSVGRFVDDPNNAAVYPTRRLSGLISAVGQQPDAAPPVPIVCDPLAPPTFIGYGPVYSPIGPSMTNRIIGFAQISLDLKGCPTALLPAPVVIARGSSHRVAESNATAVLSDRLASDLSAGEITELMDKNRSRGAGAVDYGARLVPVVAR